MSKQNELAQLADAVTVDGSSVGIGTSSPSAKLDVNGGTTYPAFKTSRDGGSAASQGYTTFGHSAVGYSGGTGADTYIVSEHGYGFAVNGGTTALAITDTGNVGIGTTSPSSNLHIKTSVDNSLAQGLIIERSANSDKGYINYQAGAFQIRATDGDPIAFGQVSNERMRIDNDGLKFNGDTAAANALNDYEEGTFTPVVEFGGGTAGITYNTRSGFYTKIGNVVYFYAECQLSSKGTDVGNLAIRDLPFTPQRTATSVSVLTGSLSSTNDIQIFISTNGKINFENRNTGTQSSLTNYNVNNNSTFFVSGTYQTNS